MWRGVLGYFPAALFEVAAHSLESDRKHNPGNPTAPNWARGKSGDHEDCIVRHLIDAGPRRKPGLAGLPLWLLQKLPGSSARDARRYHLRCLAWRALALLQEDCEATGSKPGASCTFAAEAPAPGAGLHPAQKLVADADLKEQVRSLPLGPNRRIRATKLIRERTDMPLAEAVGWLDSNFPCGGRTAQ